MPFGTENRKPETKNCFVPQHQRPECEIICNFSGFPPKTVRPAAARMRHPATPCPAFSPFSSPLFLLFLLSLASEAGPEKFNFWKIEAKASFFDDVKGLGERAWERGQGSATPGTSPKFFANYLLIMAGRGAVREGLSPLAESAPSLSRTSEPG